jgi:hypothetical protein
VWHVLNAAHLAVVSKVKGRGWQRRSEEVALEQQRGRRGSCCGARVCAAEQREDILLCGHCCGAGSRAGSGAVCTRVGFAR